MKILMVSDDFKPAATGVGTHLNVVIPLLVSRGHEISVITTRRPGEPSFEVFSGANVYRVFTVKLFGFYQALPSKAVINQILKENTIEVVHYHYLSILLMRTFREASRRALPHIYTYHMTVDHLTQPLPMRPLRPLLSRHIVRYCNRFDRIMVPSASLTKQVIASGVKTPTFYVSNPVIFSGDEVNEQRKPEAPFTVLFAGRLNPEKNVPFLLKAFSLLAKSSKDPVQLRIAGTGSSRAAYEKISHELGIGDQVHFVGFLEPNDIAVEYAHCDVFVLPSLVETQGLVAMEAMRFSKPVIVADTVISANELVEHGVNGFIVKANAIDELRDRLSDLKDNPEMRLKFGIAGKLRTNAYSPTAIVAQMEAHYKALTTH